MKTIYQISVIAILLLFSCSEDKVDGDTYGSVSGQVVAAGTFLPIENAKVFSSPSSSTVFTDADGRFTIENVTIGQYSFQAQKDGYTTGYEGVTINDGNNTEIVFELALSTAGNRPPSVPVLTAPADNLENQPLEVVLTWTATDPESDTLTYAVILRNDANNEVVRYEDLTTPTFTLTDLNFGTKYFWQVEVSDGINTPVLSPVLSFSTTMFPETRFLFVKQIDGNNVIYAGALPNTQIQLTSSNTNSWRPRRNTESDKIAFIRSMGTQNHLFIMDPDGSNVSQVTSSIPIAGFNNEFITFSWNTAGDKLIYAHFDRLYQINTDGSGLIQVYQAPSGKFISEVDWSNDGTKIALKVNNSAGYEAQIYVITMTGTLVTTVATGFSGALGGLDFSVTGQFLLYTRDISGFESPTYRQLDTRIFQYNFNTALSTEIHTEKPPGTVDLDVRYSPNEAELIFTNTSNDFMSPRLIQKFTIGANTSRTTLFANATMPDWK